MALELARKNYTVLAGVRRREDENALKALNEPRLLPVTLDVTKPRDVQRAFDMAKKEVDKGAPFVALINNAGLAKVRVPSRHSVKPPHTPPPLASLPPTPLIKERIPSNRMSSCPSDRLSSCLLLYGSMCRSSSTTPRAWTRW